MSRTQIEAMVRSALRHEGIDTETAMSMAPKVVTLYPSIMGAQDVVEAVEHAVHIFLEVELV